jgi:hypothetical protein
MYPLDSIFYQPFVVEWVWIIQSNDITFGASFCLTDSNNSNKPLASGSPKNAIEGAGAGAEAADVDLVGSIFGSAAAMLGGGGDGDESIDEAAGSIDEGSIERVERHKAQDGPRSGSYVVTGPGVLTLRWDNR